MNIAKISNFNLSFSNTFNILNAAKYSHLSLGARATYAAIYNWYKNNVKEVFVEEGTNEEFIELARTEIAKLVRVSVKTVIGYIKELSRVKLIRDKRMGAKEFNRISFYDVDEKYKYKPEDKKTKTKSTPSTPTKAATPVPPEQEGLISKVKNRVFEAYAEDINTFDAKQILMVADSKLDVIDLALKYMAGKSYTNFVAKLTDTLRNRYWEKVKPSKTMDSATPMSGNGASKPPPRNQKPNNKGRFTNISSHNWNMSKMEKFEEAYGLLSIGAITRDKYNEICDEIEKSNN